MAVLSRLLAMSLLLLPSVLAQAAAQNPAAVAPVAASVTGPATALSTSRGTKFLLDGTKPQRFSAMNAFYLTKQPIPDPSVNRRDVVLESLERMKQVNLRWRVHN